MEPIENFRSIAQNCTERLGQTFNAPDLIPFGTEILSLISQHPELRSAFGKEFVAGIKCPDKFDRWLIEFCMHALRWPELKAEFEKMSVAAIAQDNWSLIQPLQHVLDAFEDNWEDSTDIYAKYFSQMSPNPSFKRDANCAPYRYQ